MLRKLLMTGMVAVVLSAGCAAPRGKSTADKRSYVDHMRQSTLDSVEAKNPELAVRAKASAGHAVFSNIGAAWIFGGGGLGYGVVVDNKSGEKTYMRVIQSSMGLGVGLKEYKVLIIFNDSATLNTFVTSGWDFGGEAAATATSGGRGGEMQSAGSLNSRIETYHYTDRGLYVRAAIQAAKCYPDRNLNGK